MLSPRLLVLNLFIWVVAIALCCQVFLIFSGQSRAPDIFAEGTIDPSLSGSAKPIMPGDSGLEDSRLRQNVADILKSKPIDEDVFFQLAYASYLKTGNWDRLDLLRLGHERNPRNRKILGALGDAYLKKGDVPGAVSILDLLLRLDPENRSTYYSILSDIYQTKVGAKEIDTFLIDTPVWGQAFLNHEIDTASLDNIDAISLSLKQFSQSSNDIDKFSQIWERLIKMYVKLGEFQIAYDIWLSRSDDSVNLNNVQNTRGVYDPSFEKSKAPQPFNWALNSGPSHLSERNDSGGLFASYNDVKPKKIAWQIFPLNADPSQVLSSQASWNYDGDHGHFEWRFICRGSKKVLGRILFDDMSQRDSKIKTPINISDADCLFAELQLWGVPGTYSNRISIDVASVFVTSLDPESGR